MEEYNLKDTILLHDKYEKIEKELREMNIAVTTNAEYSKITIDNNVELLLQLVNDNVNYKWKASLKDLVSQIIIMFVLLILFTNKIISSLLWGKPINITTGDDVTFIVIDIFIVLTIIAYLICLPIIRKRRNKKMEIIRSELIRRNIL